MTGPEHYLEAERLLRVSRPAGTGALLSGVIARAQVHATLALASATAMGACSEEGMHETDYRAWDRVSGVGEPCPRCQNSASRQTVDMVWPACGRDYAGDSDA